MNRSIKWVVPVCLLALPCLVAASLIIYVGGPAADPPPPAFTDADADGMDDAWELDVFGSLLPDAVSDGDGDGIANLAEFTQHTNPMVSDLPLSRIPPSSQTLPGHVNLVVFSP